jgi:hypothetical protein
VLRRLHVSLSESDEDHLVEILDANRCGMVNYGSFVKFCFGSFSDSQDGRSAGLSETPSRTLELKSPVTPMNRPQSALISRPEDFRLTEIPSRSRPGRPLTATARLSSEVTTPVVRGEVLEDQTPFEQELQLHQLHSQQNDEMRYLEHDLNHYRYPLLWIS